MTTASKSYDAVEVLIPKRLIIYTRRDATSRNYYARASFPPQKGYKVWSTKTTDVDEAKRTAKNRYYELAGRQSLNISTSTASIVALMTEYLDYMDRLKQRSHDTSYRKRLERFIRPYFTQDDSAVHDLHKLQQRDIDGYWVWRLDYWFKRSQQPEYVKTKWGNNRPKYMTTWKNQNKVPSYTTLQIEVQLFRSFFKWAVSRGHMLPGNVPDVRNPVEPIEGETYKLRGVLQMHEYQELREAITARCKDYSDSKGRSLVSNRFKAERMYAYFFLIASTGLRPSEAKALTFNMVQLWKDQNDEQFSVVELPSKLAKPSPGTGRRKGRRVFSFDNHLCYNRIHKRWRAVLRETMGRANDSDYIFPQWVPKATENREEAEWKPAKMGGPFRKLLQKAGLHREKKTGRPRSAYSLRKFYITQRIRHNTPLPALALNTGHDIQTMWKWYSALKTDDMRVYLTQRDPEVMRQELKQVGEIDHAIED